MNLKTMLLCALLAWGGMRLAAAQSGGAAGPGPELRTVRATELRSDKLPNAPVLRQLAIGVQLHMLSMEGGWALVQTPASAGASPATAVAGWVRTTTLNLPPDGSTATSTGNNPTQVLGVRSLPARANRHVPMLTTNMLHASDTIGIAR